MALRRLVVEDFELIARAELDFGERLTAITGETGSGKTMLLDAIEFVLGARANADAVRSGSKRARVALELEADPRLGSSLAAQGIDIDGEDAVVIVRELADGKTSARVNGMPVSAGQLRSLAAEIAEIVGQHEAQRLLNPAHQLDALDRFGGAEIFELRERVAETHERATRAAAELIAIESAEGRALADADYASFACGEIAEAAPESGEDERLRARRDLLANSERVAAALRAAHEALSEGEGSAGDVLGAAIAALAPVARFSPSLEALVESATALQGEIGDLSARAAGELEAIEVEPGELDAITARLETLDKLKKKYGGTIEAVLEAKRGFEQTLERIAGSGERLAELRNAIAELSRVQNEAAASLTAARGKAARACEARVSSELAGLAMPAATFTIHFEPLGAIGASGAERCEFRLSANPGEPPRALARSASGGELSRVMLALTVVLADRTSTAAFIFDEIDAGIGGATANAVGARLADLARDVQVVCVTHLAQIAAYADDQVALRKSEDGTQTTIELASLDRDDRLAELARMLSGETTGVSLQHARTLLRERKQSA